MKMKRNLLWFVTGSMLLVYACSDIIFEEDISQSYVNILAPVQNANVQSGTISFNWDAVAYADNYKIQIATPNFEDAKQILADSNVTGTGFQWQLLPNSYEWRVRAQNSAFESVYFYKSLTVSEPEDFKDKEVTLISPADNFVTNNLQQTLAWESVEGATDYRLQIYQPDANGTFIDEETTLKTSVDYEFAEGTFTWQVRAQNTSQNTLFFSRKLLVDTTDPAMVTLESPENESIEEEGKTKFIWQRADLSGSVEFDSIYIYNDKELLNLITKERSDSKQFEKEMTADDYYWFVRAFDEAGNSSDKSAVFKLEVN